MAASVINLAFLKKLKFPKNGSFDFLTACHEIKFDEL